MMGVNNVGAEDESGGGYERNACPCSDARWSGTEIQRGANVFVASESGRLILDRIGGNDSRRDYSDRWIREMTEERFEPTIGWNAIGIDECSD